MFERTDEPYWKGIAGGGEEGESPVGAAKRETLEEANIPEAARYYTLKTTSSVPAYHFTARFL